MTSYTLYRLQGVTSHLLHPVVAITLRQSLLLRNRLVEGGSFSRTEIDRVGFNISLDKLYVISETISPANQVTGAKTQSFQPITWLVKSVTGHFGYQTVHLLLGEFADWISRSLCTYSVIQCIQQELRDHYRSGSRMNSRMSIVTSAVREVCSRWSVQGIGELSSR